jgi:hypothetical protein
LLIYADLMDTRDQCCIEEAQKIYKEYVENWFWLTIRL